MKDLQYEDTLAVPGGSRYDDSSRSRSCSTNTTNNVKANDPDSLQSSCHSSEDSESLNSRHSSDDSFDDECVPLHDFKNTACPEDKDTGPAMSGVADLRSSLCTWALENNITQSATDDLLKILKPYHSTLPGSCKALLKTPRSSQSDVKSVTNGEFWYKGIAPNLHSKLRQNNLLGEIVVDINIDGLPLYKSSSINFWPILGCVEGKQETPFIIGVFCGHEKPGCLDEFLGDFAKEVSDLTRRKLEYNGKCHNFRIGKLILDAPARAFVKCCKSHTGYFGCEKCTQEGDYFKDRMTLPECTASLRTDESFRAMQQEEHHVGTSPLLEIGIGMVSQFPLDYMHLVCLGVTKRLLHFWLKGKGSYRISRSAVRVVSDNLEMLAPHMPHEFCRQLRGLKDWHRYKATEYRQILLYVGAVAFKGNLRDDVYDNFMLLQCAIYILASPTLCKGYSDYANYLLQEFVKDCIDLYGQEFVVYNVHNLIHLAADVKQYGELDKFSAFKYENYLKTIKQRLRSTNKPLQQLYMRDKERMALDTKPKIRKIQVLFRQHYGGPMHNLHGKQYKKVTAKGFTLEVSRGNNCCEMEDGAVVIIKNIVDAEGQIHLVGSVFKDVTDWYLYPFPSSRLGIFKVSKLKSIMQAWPLEQVRKKYVLLPLHNDGEGTNVCIPLLHTEE